MIWDQLAPPTLVILMVESIIFGAQFCYLLWRPKSKSRQRFLLLVTVFIAYNITSIWLPWTTDELNTFGLVAFAFARGVVLGTFYVYYLIKEIEIPQSKLFNARILLYSLVASFVFAFVVVRYFFDRIDLSIMLIKVLPIFISFYFVWMTTNALSKKWEKHSKHKTPFRIIIYSSFIGAIFVATMPISIFFNDVKLYNIILVNVGMFLMAYAYLREYIFQKRIQMEALTGIGFFDQEEQKTFDNTLGKPKLEDAKLTAREREIVYMMEEGLSYAQIAEDMFIAQKTVSKHASNIFKKTNVTSREEFMKMYN